MKSPAQAETPKPANSTSALTPRTERAKQRLFSLVPADLGPLSQPPPPPPPDSQQKRQERVQPPLLTITPRKASPMLLLGLSPKASPGALKNALLRARKSPASFFTPGVPLFQRHSPKTPKRTNANNSSTFLSHPRPSLKRKLSATVTEDEERKGRGERSESDGNDEEVNATPRKRKQIRKQ